MVKFRHFLVKTTKSLTWAHIWDKVEEFNLGPYMGQGCSFNVGPYTTCRYIQRGLIGRICAFSKGFLIRIKYAFYMQFSRDLFGVRVELDAECFRENNYR